MQLNTKVKKEAPRSSQLPLTQRKERVSLTHDSKSDGHTRQSHQTRGLGRVPEASVQLRSLHLSLMLEPPCCHRPLSAVPPRTLRPVILMEETALKPGCFQRERAALSWQIHLSWICLWEKWKCSSLEKDQKKAFIPPKNTISNNKLFPHKQISLALEYVPLLFKTATESLLTKESLHVTQRASQENKVTWWFMAEAGSLSGRGLGTEDHFSHQVPWQN